MSEVDFHGNPILIDRKVPQRVERVVEAGQSIFENSALLDPSRSITNTDLTLIENFHREVSPTNPDNPWRKEPAGLSRERGEIADPSSFGNWETAGGPLGHIRLASQAAAVIVEELKSHLKSASSPTDPWAENAIQQIQSIDPNHTAAAAALHDEGREVTHLFYTNDRIGRLLLRKIGIREDIMSILPDEKVMQVSEDENMDEYVQQMPAEAVIVRIADEFGKRKGGTNRLLQPSDFDPQVQDQWAENYLRRPFSGRPTDKWFREHVGLHNANAPRYFQALDNWVRGVSGLSLDQIAQNINEKLAPTLAPLTNA